MNLSAYQIQARRTLNCAMTPTELLANLVFGLCGETGEIADHLKKGVFHKHGVDKEVLKKEMGDVLWYLSALASYYDLSLDEIAQMNIEKLWVRYPNGFSCQDSKERKDK